MRIFVTLFSILFLLTSAQKLNIPTATVAYSAYQISPTPSPSIINSDGALPKLESLIVEDSPPSFFRILLHELATRDYDNDNFVAYPPHETDEPVQPRSLPTLYEYAIQAYNEWFPKESSNFTTTEAPTKNLLIPTPTFEEAPTRTIPGIEFDADFILNRIGLVSGICEQIISFWQTYLLVGVVIFYRHQQSRQQKTFARRLKRAGKSAEWERRQTNLLFLRAERLVKNLFDIIQTERTQRTDTAAKMLTDWTISMFGHTEEEVVNMFDKLVKENKRYESFYRIALQLFKKQEYTEVIAPYAPSINAPPYITLSSNFQDSSFKAMRERSADGEEVMSEKDRDDLMCFLFMIAEEFAYPEYTDSDSQCSDWSDIHLS